MFGSEHRLREQEELRLALAELLPRLRRFGRAMTGSVSEGDDLAQAACERALQRFAQLRVEARLDSWMYTMMRRMWIDEMRSRRVRQHEPIDAAEEVIGEEGEAVVEGQLTLAAVRRALAKLPEEQRTVLTLVCVDGLSYKQTAEVLGIAIGTVMSRLARGREALHQQMLKPPADRVTDLRFGRRP
jgi:RNA polymerase sigma-70 factor, ECF subfamily